MVIKNIQALRALAANAVIVAHLVAIEQKYGGGFAILPPAAHAGICGVDLFFVISGFIMARVEPGATWPRFLAHRVFRIFPPYWFYTTLVLAASLLAPGLVNASFSHAPSLWRSYLLIPDEGTPLLAVGWTLVHEIYFYLVFTLLIGLARRFRFAMPSGLAAWAMVVIIGHAATKTQSPFGTLILHPLTLEFIAGGLLGYGIRAGMDRFGLAATVIGVCGIAATPGLLDRATLDAFGWAHVAAVGMPCLFLVYGAVAMEREGLCSARGLSVTLGNVSYSTYLSHVLVLSAIGRVFAAAPGHGFHFEIAFVGVGLMAANGWGMVSYRLIEKPGSRLARRFLGVKKPEKPLDLTV